MASTRTRDERAQRWRSVPALVAATLAVSTFQLFCAAGATAQVKAPSKSQLKAPAKAASNEDIQPFSIGSDGFVVEQLVNLKVDPTDARAASDAVSKALSQLNAKEASSGRAILASQAMGADFAYIGSAFIATDEARAVDGYKQMITQSNSDDIVYSNFYTGIHGNYLKGSIRNAGMDPDHLPESDPSKMNFSTGEGANAAKAWKDIWGCGQGIGAITEVLPTAELVARFKREYQEAKDRLLTA